MMKLLTFAHRGEAQAFIDHFDFKVQEFYFNGLFKSDSYLLLLTDEGAHSASEKTVAVLSSFKNEIDEIINLGVAGGLSSKAIKNQTYWIRTAYAHHAEKLEFKSYSSTLETSEIDCLTAYNRILSASDRDKLSSFADLVDRELWAVASAANLFKIPFAALKIVSDVLEESEEKREICQVVKEDAPHYSHILLQAFLNRISNKKISPQKKSDLPFIHDEAFYFTTTQERKLKSLIEGLSLKKIQIPQEVVENLVMQPLLPKERSRQLLVELNDLLNPFAKKMRAALDKAVEPLTQAGITSQYNANLEQSLLHLTLHINSERDLEKAKNALKIFSYSDYKKIFDGEFDDV